MKKILLKVVIGLVILIILGVLAVSLFLDSGVKRGVETFGPQLTKVSVKLDNVSISMLSGSGSIKGLVVGNPEGYKTPQAISVGSATLALKPMSVLGDKIIINKIEVIEPEITFEGGLTGNNLSKILSNLEESMGGGSTNAPAGEKGSGPSRKLQVDDFLIKGAKVNVSIAGTGGKSIPVVIPDIHLTDLGTGPEGITAAELTKRALSAIEKGALKAASSAIGDIGKGAENLTKDLGKTATGSVSNITKGLGDIFKKK
ncbi:MAG TPA: hypothetical protein VK327_03775 [Candidatus Paceibacterota bacterium]|nr:hypothetical protein [Candidatus Paceibacterota bacterium]